MASWAKAPLAIGTVACAACLAIAGTMTSSIPAAQKAAERLSQAELRLAGITDIDAFSGIPALLDLLQGNIDTLLADDDNNGYDLLSAIDIFFGDAANGEGGVFSDGNIDALRNYALLSAIPEYAVLLDPMATLEAKLDALRALDSVSATPEYYVLLDPSASEEDKLDALSNLDSVSAIPPYIAIARATTAQEAAAATGDLDSLSAIDTFFGDGPLGGPNGETAIGPVFGDGGIDALAPGADGAGGYAALSALPVFFGRETTDGGVETPFGPGLFNGGGINALRNYDAFSAIPEYAESLQSIEVQPFARTAGPEARTQTTLSNLDADQDQDLQQAKIDVQDNSQDNAGAISAQQLGAVAPAAAPAAPASPPAAPSTPPVDSKPKNVQGNGNIGLFKPKPVVLFGVGSGDGAVDNSIRGYGDMLKKIGLNGGPDADGGGAPAGGAPGGAPGGGTP